MSVPNPFRCAFPLVKLPDRLGGGDAIVLMSVAEPKKPQICFCVCIDRLGRIHQNVPFSLFELQLAATPDRRGHFLQVSADEFEAPLVQQIVKS